MDDNMDAIYFGDTRLGNYKISNCYGCGARITVPYASIGYLCDDCDRIISEKKEESEDTPFSWLRNESDED